MNKFRYFCQDIYTTLSRVFHNLGFGYTVEIYFKFRKSPG